MIDVFSLKKKKKLHFSDLCITANSGKCQKTQLPSISHAHSEAGGNNGVAEMELNSRGITRELGTTRLHRQVMLKITLNFFNNSEMFLLSLLDADAFFSCFTGHFHRDWRKTNF